MGILRVNNIPLYIGLTGVLTLVGYTMMGDEGGATPHMDGTSGLAVEGRKPAQLSLVKNIVSAPVAAVVTATAVAPTGGVVATNASTPSMADLEAKVAALSKEITADESDAAAIDTVAAAAAPAAPVAAVATNPVAAINLDVDPFAGGGGVVAAPDDTGEIVSTEDAKNFPGIEILPKLGIAIPELSFTLDLSDEAKAERMASSVKQYEDEGLPTEVAKLKAQLVERELFGKATRATHSRKRTIVRLIQEAKLKKDAVARDQRMQLLQMKQEAVQKQMAEEQALKADNEKEKEANRKDRDAKLAAERKQLEETKAMMAKMRLDAVENLAKENEERKKQEKEEKKNDALEREDRDRKEKESKRKMMEEFQAQMQASLEDQKRLAREERIAEANAARESRLSLEASMGLKTKPLLTAADDLGAR